MSAEAYCKAELAEFPPAPAEGGAVGCPSGTVTLACGRGGVGGEVNASETCIHKVVHRSCGLKGDRHMLYTDHTSHIMSNIPAKF